MLRWLRNFPIVLRTLVMTVVAVIIVLAFFAFLGSDALDDSTLEIQRMQLRYAGLAADALDSQLENSFRALARQAQALAFDTKTSTSVDDVLSRLANTGLFPGGVFFLDPAGAVTAAEPSLTGAAVKNWRKTPSCRKLLRPASGKRGIFNPAPAAPRK